MANIVLKGPDDLDHTIPGVNAVRLRLAGGGTVDFTPGGLMGRMADRSITAVTAEDLAGVTEIGPWAFAGCESLLTAELPATVTKLGHHAFYYSGLTGIVIPYGVTELENNAFYGCLSLVSLTLPESLTTVGQYALGGLGVTSLTIPDSVTSLGLSAVTASASMTTLVIGSGVTSIPGGFSLDLSLRSLTCKPTTPPGFGSGTGQFSGVPADCAIYVPAGSVAAYKAAAGWSDRAAYIRAIPT